MKKNNQKGFMLVEAFIVSTFVLGVLVFMFVQIRTIINGFDRSFSYNTVPGIYIANELSEIITNFDENIKQIVQSEGYVIKMEDAYLSSESIVNNAWNTMLRDANVKTLIISTSDLIRLKDTPDNNISNKLKDYISHLDDDNVGDQYRIIIEFNDETFASVKFA